jgi:hypothetical protein
MFVFSHFLNRLHDPEVPDIEYQPVLEYQQV